MFQRNIDIIERRWPYLAEQISCAPLPAQVEIVNDAPETTLVVDGIQLSSRYDRLREARLQASLVPNGSSEAYVYGLETGDLPRVLLAREDLTQLSLTIMSLAVAHASLKYIDHRDWLTDPRVSLLTAAAGDHLQLPFACAAASLYLVDDISARLRDQLCLELATPYINRKHHELGQGLLERLAANKNFWAVDPGVSAVWKKRPDRPIVIAAAGATLLDQYAWLREQRTHYQLIAVDAAVKPLAQAGIIPDYIFSVDSYPYLFDIFYQPLDLSRYADVTLIYFPQVDRQVLTNWPGPRLLAYSNQQLFQTVQQARPGNRLFTSGSVIHSVVDLAVKQGAREIYLCGADFSYTKGVRRVEEVGMQELPPVPEEYWVLNSRAEKVWTGLALRGYLRDLEHYISWHPRVRFVNCSSEGAHVEGTELQDGGPRWAA